MNPERKFGPIVSPCHGKPIYIAAWGDEYTIWCSEHECYNTWDGNGKPE